MGRKKSEVQIETDAQALDGEIVNSEQNEIAARSQQIVEQFGDGMPFDLYRYEDKVRDHMSRSAQEAIAGGRALIVIREHTPKGDWLQSLERTGLEPRLAQRMMQAAFKLANASAPTHLIESIRSKTKLFELMVLDDDELEELTEGGTVAGLKLDEIDKMSSRELRKSLREAKQDAEAQREVMASKNQKIDDLATKLKKDKIKKIPPDESAATLRKEASTSVFSAEEQIRVQLREALQTVQNYAEESGIDQTDYITKQLDLLDDALLYVRGELGIERTRDMTNEAPWADPDFDSK